MKKRHIAIAALMFASCLALTGCFGGMNEPQPTVPPQQTFGSIEEFRDAVTKAKADTSATDLENLKGLAYFYEIQSPPGNAAVSSIMASTDAVRVRYSFGPVAEDNFDNQIEIDWYRTADAGNFMNQVSSSMSNTAAGCGTSGSGATYDTIASGDITYLRTVPTVNVVATPSPGGTAQAAPTSMSTTFCQFVYWVQDGAAFVAAVPLGFTNDDICKYCLGEKVDLNP
jgi:hypothetical protein